MERYYKRGHSAKGDHQSRKCKQTSRKHSKIISSQDFGTRETVRLTIQTSNSS